MSRLPRCVLLVLASASMAIGCGGAHGNTTTAHEHSAAHSDRHWGYDGAEGPAHWAELSKDFHACGAGKAQSPIDLREGTAQDVPQPAMHDEPSKLELINNGHTIEAAVTGNDTLELEGKTYTLAQFHFHHPSEHTVEGKSFPMEVHLVHKAQDGSIAVVGVLFEEGAALDELTPVWSELPADVGEQRTIKATFNPRALLPDDRTSFAYTGSLTTPPCTEGVHWFVVKTPKTASADQLAAFAKLYDHNNRPVQPQNQRPLLIESISER